MKVNGKMQKTKQNNFVRLMLIGIIMKMLRELLIMLKQRLRNLDDGQRVDGDLNKRLDLDYNQHLFFRHFFRQHHHLSKKLME